MNIPKRVLCKRGYPDRSVGIGRESVCEIKEGRGSCGEKFFEDEGVYCRWCCQIIEFQELPK